MKLSISARLVLLVALLVTTTAATISYYLYKSSTRILVEHALQDLSHNVQRDGDRLSGHIEELKRDVLFLSNSPPVPGLMRAQKNKGYDPVGQSSTRLWQQRLTSLFSTLLSTNPDYMQVRLLDARGNELIKVNQDEQGIHLTPAPALQNKGASAYFKESTQVPVGQTYLSPIGLNREFGKISRPYTPVLRCATVVFDKGKLFAVIIINLNFSHLLKELEQTYSTNEQTLYVTNHQGAYLSHPDRNKRFAFELGHYFRLQEDYPLLADLFAPDNRESSRNIIPQDPQGKIMVFVKIPLAVNHPDRFIAVGLNRSYAQILAQESQILQQSFAIIILFILLSVLLALGFANLLVRPLKQIAANLEVFSRGDRLPLPIKRSDEIGALARALDSMADNVFQSHQQLRTLNARLEDKVEERTEEVRQNLRLVNAISAAQAAFIRDLNPLNAFELMLNGLLELSESEYGFIGEVVYRDNHPPCLHTYVTTNIAWDDARQKFYADNIESGLEFTNLNQQFGRVILTGETVISNEPAGDPPPPGHPILNNFLGIPVKHAERLVGMIAIANRPGAYHAELLAEIAPLINTCANLILAYQTRIEAEHNATALTETRVELERVISISPVVFYTARAHGDYGATFISPNIRQQLGYEAHEFTDDPAFWAEHIHPEDRQDIFRDLGKVFEHGHHVHSYRFKDKAGHYRWMRDELQLIKGANGEPREIAGYWLDITDQKQAELQLLESEQRFRHMADNAPALIWLADTDNQGTWFNKHWLDYTGRSLEQELGLGWAEGVHPDDLAISVEKCNAAFNRREPFEMEFRLRCADDSYGWIADTGIPRFTEDGEFEGYIGYCWDITDRKLTEQALQESENKFRSITSSSPMGIIIYKLVNDQLIFSDYNPAADNIMGVDCSRFVGQTIETAFPNTTGTDAIPHLRRAARDGIPWHTEDVYYDDRANVAGAFEVHVFQTAPNTLAVMFMDITERKQAQDDLTRFKSTLDQTQDCVFMFNAESLQYFYANQGAMFLVGYSEAELMQLHPYDINNQINTAEEFRALVKPLLDVHQPSLIFETEYRCKDQSLVPVEVILQYITHQGQAPRYVAMVRDITERRKIDRMKNEFVSTVSHELRTPLTSIRGALGLLTGGAVGHLPEQMQQMLHIASNNTDRLLLLINDILDIQKIESGQMSFHFTAINIMPLIEQAVSNNSAYAEQYNVRFEITHRKDRAHILGDHDRLMQVMNNLMSNAAKFSPTGSAVELAVAQHGNAIRISVTDHGQGIPEEFQPRLFEQFTQSDASDSRQKGGTGLGLSIVKAIINKHGGRLDYITREGLGTTMFIELPVCQSGTRAETDTSPLRLGEHKPCLLIVEDDPDIAMLLKRLMSEAGYNCDNAYTAAEARRLLQANIAHYKAMTLDIRLPDSDGISFINELRASPETRALPIIVVSVEADAARHRLNGGAIGILDWLDKPIDEQRLLNTLESACRNTAMPRLLHIEDEPDVNQIVSILLKDKAKLRWASNLQQARKLLAKEHFELILLDISLPDGSGLSLLSEIEQQHPGSKLVIYSAHDLAPKYLQQVHAVLTKSTTDNDQLLRTIESLLAAN